MRDMPAIPGVIAEECKVENPEVRVEVVSRTKTRAVRPMGFIAGLVTAQPLVYDTKHVNNVIAAINKNIAPQINRGVMEIDESVLDEFVCQETTDGIDVMTPAVTLNGTIWTKQQVIENTRAKGNTKKTMKYMLAQERLSGTSLRFEERTKVQGGNFVKLEALKQGKPPRFIFDSPGEDVLLGRQCNAPFEKWMARYPSIKGLKTQDKWKPVKDVHDALGGDTWILALDDTARDANTVSYDFLRYRKTLSAIGILSQEFAAILDRRGFRNCVKINGLKVITINSKTTSLHSGCDFTSCLNYNTTRFNAWYLCAKVLGLQKHQWGVVAEGDDCLILISKPALPDFVNIVTPELIAATGAKLCKNWKIEGMGPHDQTTGHPFVGGCVVWSMGQVYFFPSVSRMRLKATTVLSPSVNYKECIGRLSARAEALTDRYSGVPLGYSIAKFVAYLSSKYPSRPRRTNEEEFDHQNNVNTNFRKYTSAELYAFSKCYGISPMAITEFDNIIDGLIRDDVEVYDARHLTANWC